MRSPLLLVVLLACTIDCGTPQSPRAESPKAVSGHSESPPTKRDPEAKSSPSKKAPPISLTASDGTGLRLIGLKTRAILDEPLAYTEVQMSFVNPNARELEGRFEIALPPGVTVSRFAMKIGSAWQEAEMVETMRARQVYESFLHRKKDPALLEQAAGNSFSARIFPIPANGTKEILIAYAQELTSEQNYSFPLAGLPAMEHADVAIFRAGSDRPIQEWKYEGGAALEEDAVVASSAGENGQPRWDGVRSGNLVLTRVRPETQVGADSFEGGVLLLVDTSASRAPGFGDQVLLVQRLAKEIERSHGPNTHLVVAAFDQQVARIYDGTVTAFDAGPVERLLARGALGASNLEGALGWVAANAQAVRRVIVVGDGVATAGSDSGADLAAAARRLGEAGVERVDAVAVGGIRDEQTFAHVTRGALPHDGIVVDGRDWQEIMRRLTRGAISGLAVNVEGASWVWPERLDGVQPGDERFVYAAIPEGVPVRLRLGEGETSTPRLRTVGRPLLEHTWARAKVASILAASNGAPDEEARARVINLSQRFRVMSPFTSLLVLETENDYLRFGMDRTAPREQMLIRGSRVVSERYSPALSPGYRGDAGSTTNRPMVNGALRAPSTPSDGEPVTVDVGRSNIDRNFSSRIPITNPGAHGGAQRSFESIDESQQPSWQVPMAEAHSADSLGPTVWRWVAPGQPEDNRPTSSHFSSYRNYHSRPYHHDPRPREPAEPTTTPDPGKPYTGAFDDVMTFLGNLQPNEALELVRRWRRDAPTDVLALVALGEVLEFNEDWQGAARSYGSIIDLFPTQTNLRRFAGERLERVRAWGALDLAIDTYGKAAKQRPDHPTGHRLLAFARLRNGDYAGAFEAACEGLAQAKNQTRSVDRVLREDVGLIAAAWLRMEPFRKEELLKRLDAAGAKLETTPSLRFVLNWETDANNVDLEVVAVAAGHTGTIDEYPYANVVDGFGPECVTIHRPRAERSGSYRVRARYSSRGAMGYGMGKVEIIDHDGNGYLTFEERPFVIVADGAAVYLGSVD